MRDCVVCASATLLCESCQAMSFLPPSRLPPLPASPRSSGTRCSCRPAPSATAAVCGFPSPLHVLKLLRAIRCIDPGLAAVHAGCAKIALSTRPHRARGPALLDLGAMEEQRRLRWRWRPQKRQIASRATAMMDMTAPRMDHLPSSASCCSSLHTVAWACAVRFPAATNFPRSFASLCMCALTAPTDGCKAAGAPRAHISSHLALPPYSSLPSQQSQMPSLT